MRIKLLDKLTTDWSCQWIVLWFAMGVTALTTGFWLTTQHTLLDWFYLLVSISGLVCVVSLAFRKNLTGNGLAILVTAGEVVVHATAGTIGLVLSPLFNFFTHIYGFVYWSKNTDAKGKMIPKSATKWVWLLTAMFIAIGLLLFPLIETMLAARGIKVIQGTSSIFLGQLDFYWVNILVFVLAITAQTTMILRYKFSWWIWIAANFAGLTVNLMAQNYIFAIQTMVYQLNACIALYSWHHSDTSK